MVRSVAASAGHFKRGGAPTTAPPGGRGGTPFGRKSAPQPWSRARSPEALAIHKHVGPHTSAPAPARNDSRIFQDMAVPAIIEKVLKDGGLAGADYRLSLTGTHPTREYCVQYRESDLAFISRLMEEEGIFYYFEHSDGKHVLVM